MEKLLKMSKFKKGDLVIHRASGDKSVVIGYFDSEYPDEVRVSFNFDKFVDIDQCCLDLVLVFDLNCVKNTESREE